MVYIRDQKIDVCKGIGFEVFFNEIHEMFRLGETQAQVIFEIFKDTKCDQITWDEFIDMMSQTKARSQLEKVKLFQILADQDGNQSLSYSEILELAKDSIGSMLRYNQDDF